MNAALEETFTRINTGRLEFIVRQLQLIAQKYNSCMWNMTTLDKILFARYLEDIDTVRTALVLVYCTRLVLYVVLPSAPLRSRS